MIAKLRVIWRWRSAFPVTRGVVIERARAGSKVYWVLLAFIAPLHRYSIFDLTKRNVALTQPLSMATASKKLTPRVPQYLLTYR